jgi:hypothetical protein
MSVISGSNSRVPVGAGAPLLRGTDVENEAAIADRGRKEDFCAKDEAIGLAARIVTLELAVRLTMLQMFRLKADMVKFRLFLSIGHAVVLAMDIEEGEELLRTRMKLLFGSCLFYVG